MAAFLICERHGKNQKTGDKALASGHICMNKSCPQSFKVFCSGCKNQHRDHSDKTLTLEDVSFLLGRLLKSPSKEMTKPLGDTLQIMKKLKFIKQFRKKINILEREIERYCLELIAQTESIVDQYSSCKQDAINLQSLFALAQKPQDYKQLLESSKSLLKSLEYNSKKDKLEFGNAQIKEKQDRRKKIVDSTKRKIEEVRDYSMKIIEVIFHNEDSEDEQEDTAYKKKHYQVLKAQLCLQNSQLLSESLEDLRNSRTTASKSIIRRDFAHQESQTELLMYTSQELNAKIQEKISQLKHSHCKSQIDFRQKLHAATRQKENLSRQLTRLKQKFDEKRKSITHIETQLRYNRGIRSQNLKKRQDLMNKFIEIWPMRCPDNEDKND